MVKYIKHTASAPLRIYPNDRDHDFSFFSASFANFSIDATRPVYGKSMTANPKVVIRFNLLPLTASRSLQPRRHHDEPESLVRRRWRSQLVDFALSLRRQR
jgi:hypothetical protein